MVRLLVLCLILLPGLANAAFSARFDPDTLRINETTRLILEADEETRGEVNLSPIEAHFKILSQATTQNVTILGGRQTIVQRLVMELEPKDIGSFSIGPIVQGNQRSEVLRVTVLPELTGASGDAELFIEAEVDLDRVYVQQQVVLTVKLFLGVRLLDGSLSDPQPPSTRVERMGDDARYQVSRNNREFTVYERRYALFPQASGKLEIPSLQFQGIAEDKNGGGQVFGSLFNQGRRIRAQSPSFVIDVVPPAPAFTGQTWLPATGLQIDEVGDIMEQVEAGQPLTRRIQVQTKGLTAEQLPEVDFGAVGGIRFYPDKSVRDTAVAADTMIGVLQNSVAIIAAEPGIVTLPEIKIDWWNTATDEQETAVLAARDMRIVASSTAPAAPPRSPPAADVSAQPDPEKSDDIVVGNDEEARIWKLVAAGALLLWLGTVALLWFLQRPTWRAKRLAPIEPAVNPAISSWRDRLQQACQDDDAGAARAALLGWLKARHGYHTGIADIGALSGYTHFANLATDLDRQLYSTGDNALTWRGQPLWEAFKSLPASPTRSAPRQTLEALYPRVAGD